MDSLWLALYWGSPIGLGIFLVCVGGMVCLLSKADEIAKRTRAFVKEKGLEKKKDNCGRLATRIVIASPSL
jgi:hypothetical protein